MATSGTVLGNTVMGSEGSYIDWQLVGQDTAGNFSSINWQAGWRFPAATCRGLRLGGAYVAGTLVWQNLSGGDGVHAFNSSHLSSAQHTPKLQTASGNIWIGHNADGTKSFNLYVEITGWNGGPNLFSGGSGWFDLPTIPRASAPPVIFSITEVTQTSMHVYWGDGGGGAPVDSRQIGYGTNPSGPTTIISADGTDTLTGLTPGTVYYVWTRTHNVVGYSDWSPRASAMTIAGARVLVGGVWKQAIPYVKVGGVWKLARPWVKVLGVWKESQ